MSGPACLAVWMSASIVREVDDGLPPGSSRPFTCNGWVQRKGRGRRRRLAALAPLRYGLPVPDPEFHDAALLLVAHGSTQNDDSSRAALVQAGRLRDQGRFARVALGFWKQEPPVAQVLAELTERRVFIVPLMISDGYFAGEVIPRALGFDAPADSDGVRRRTVGGQFQCYCPPVGTHPRMAELLERQAEEVVTRHPFPRRPTPAETTLFIAGHGTARSSRSREAVELQAGRIRERGGYAAVHAVFLEETPRIADTYELAGTRHVVVVPFFISDGLHVAEDLPVLLGEPEALVRERLQRGQATWRNPTERRGRRVWLARGLGEEALVGDVVLERAREAAAA